MKTIVLITKQPERNTHIHTSYNSAE